MKKLVSPIFMLSCLILFSNFSTDAIASEYCVQSISSEEYKPFMPPHPSTASGRELQKEILSMSVVARLKNDTLSFTDKSGKTYEVEKLKSEDDFNGWESINELEDNWLYIGGTQYNHVIHLKQNSDKEWEENKIFHIKKDEGFVEKFGRFILRMDAEQIKRNKLTAILRVHGHSIYSEALHKLFYPIDSKEFINGKLAPFDYKDAKTYIGDIPRWGVAFFKTNMGQIFSYDGKNFKPVKNGQVAPFFVSTRLERGIISNISTPARSFYSIRSGIYEFLKQNDGYELSQINLPEKDSFLFFTTFIPTPDHKDIAILTNSNIYLLSNLQGVFPNRKINTTGSDVLPALIPELNGILFSTGGRHVSDDKTEYFYLMKKCSK